jgi:L-threonylcarbamoyladenylate synthase
MAQIGTSVLQAADLLQRGELVAIPTETVYGLAAHALRPDAVVKIFETKQRPFFDPLIVHIASAGQVENYAVAFPDAARKLANAFWPGPLTLLLPRAPLIPDLVTAGLPTVGLRCPRHPLLQQLLSMLDFPLAAPSANPFGYVSPTRAAHVQEQLGEKIPFILDGGACAVGIESTIVGFENGVTIHRLGGIPVEEVERVVGSVQVATGAQPHPLAPGQLPNHYSPAKKLIVGDLPELIAQHRSRRFSVLSFSHDFHAGHQLILSDTGDLREAAQRLFAALRELDKADTEVILAGWAPDVGLGRAINDRLRRAAK